MLRRAEDRGGKILVPSFALERTHEVLYTLAHLERDHDITPLPSTSDLAVGTKVDEVYSRHPEELSEELRLLRSSGRTRSWPKHLRYTRSVDDSRALTASKGPAIVIAGSGMMSGGRILHHLASELGDPSATVLIVGFQPKGGLGRELVEGADRVRVMGREVTVGPTSPPSAACPPTPTAASCSTGSGPPAPAPRCAWSTASPGRRPASETPWPARGIPASLQPSERSGAARGPRPHGGGGGVTVQVATWPTSHRPLPPAQPVRPAPLS